jgi:peptidoglycan hydrolase CwlO-like protein
VSWSFSGKQAIHILDVLGSLGAAFTRWGNSEPKRETQQNKSGVHPQVIETKLQELENLNTTQSSELKEHDNIISRHESEIEEQRKLVEEHEKIINRHTSEIEEQRKLIAGRAIWLWALGGLNFVFVVTLIAVLLSRR